MKFLQPNRRATIGFMLKLIKALQDLDLAAVTAILDADPSLATAGDAKGKQAVHYLCEVAATTPERGEKKLEILKLLVERGADLNATHEIKDGEDVMDASPLWYAYAHGRDMVAVNYLLEQGVSPENCMFAVAWADDVESGELFKRYGAAVDPIAHATTPFFAAFLWKKFTAADWFLANGANVDFADKDGRTALFHAIRKRFTPAQIETLLKAGADARHADNQGVTPLQVAERNREHAIVRMIEASAPAK
jgi:ankyrin repeat protein